MSGNSQLSEVYYYFSSERICSVVDSTEDQNKEEDKFQDYQCYICYELSLNIQECKSCERIFCNKCIESIKEQKKGQSVQCPNYCKVWQLDKPHRSIRNFIENIEFYCKKYQQGCRQKLKLNNASQHETNECDYNMNTCKNEGCEQQISVKQIKQHQEFDCNYRRIKCEKCELEFKFCDQDKHDCIEGLKMEVAFLKQKISSMYTKEQLNDLLEEYIKGISLDDKNKSSNNQDVYGYEYPREEEVLVQKKPQEEVEEEEQKNQQNEEQSNQKKKEKSSNPFRKMFEIGVKFLKEQAENSKNYQQQQYSQNNNNLPQYPPQLNQSNFYPPQQNQSNVFPPQSNIYPPQNYNYNNQQYNPYSNSSNVYYPNSSQYNANPSYYPPQPSFPQSSIYPPNQNTSYQHHQGHSSHHVTNFGCNHSELNIIIPAFPVNKICKCGKFIQYEYYFCNSCSSYICKDCKL